MPDVSRLRELLAEGTPGSWVDRGKGGIGDRILRPCVHGSTAPVPANDAALICAAVNALPKLLDVVEAAREWRDAEDALDALMDEVIPGEPWLRSDEERVAYGRIEIAGDALRAALASLETET